MHSASKRECRIAALCQHSQRSCKAVMQCLAHRRNGQLWWIQSVYVHPEYRRRGHFRALYQHAQQQARQEEAVGLRLYVDTHNAHAQDTVSSCPGTSYGCWSRLMACVDCAQIHAHLLWPLQPISAALCDFYCLHVSVCIRHGVGSLRRDASQALGLITKCEAAAVRRSP